MMLWYVYILECGDGSLYTGISHDVQARLKRHNSGRGARYTRSHRPCTLAWVSPPFVLQLGAALAENSIKRMSRAQKLMLIYGSSEQPPTERVF